MSMTSMAALWAFPSDKFPGHQDFMWIDEDRNRIITFMTINATAKRAPMRAWYQPVTANSIRARIRLDCDWLNHEFRLDGDCIVWRFRDAGKDQAWQRVPKDEYPDWLERGIAKSHAKMDEVERESGVRPVDGGEKA